MAVEVEVVGNGKFKGSRSNILKYSVNEDATPTRPGDFSGGTGTVDFSASEVTGYKGSTLLMNDTINLSDTGSGTTTGKVDSLTIENGVVSVSGLSRLELLNASANIPLVDGTLDSVVRQILALAGITTGIVIDTAIQSTPVRGRGGEKSYWLFLKELCAAYQVEISLVSNNVVVRGLRQRSAFTGKIESQSYSVGNGDLARNIEVAYYNYQTISSALVYPYGGWTSDVDVFQVDASESRTINIPVDVNIASLSQPTMVSSVARDYSGPTSVYAIAGNDGLPIAPALWADNGGSLSVSIGEDRESIDVKVRGMYLAEYAPYQIAMSSGPSDYYSSLRLIGSGTGFTRKTVIVPTGVPASKTSTDLGTTIDNPFISSKAAAQSAALLAAGSLASAEQSIRITATFINRATESGSYVYPLFSDYNATAAGTTFADFATTWSGQTFAQFDDAQFALVQEQFANQVFGNVAGARIRYGDAVYRIRSATISEDGITSATAETDTIFSDFDTAWSGKTFSQFDSHFAGLKFEDYSMIPLAKP